MVYVLRHGFRAQETKKGFFVFWNLRVSVHDSCITFVAIHARVPFCGRCMMPEAGLEAMGKGRAPEQCVALRVFELPMYNVSIYSEETGSRSTCSCFRVLTLDSYDSSFLFYSYTHIVLKGMHSLCTVRILYNEKMVTCLRAITFPI